MSGAILLIRGIKLKGTGFKHTGRETGTGLKQEERLEFAGMRSVEMGGLAIAVA